jgi:hypothetical protein
MGDATESTSRGSNFPLALRPSPDRYSRDRRDHQQPDEQRPHMRPHTPERQVPRHLADRAGGKVANPERRRELSQSHREYAVTNQAAARLWFLEAP